jgi:hypothetical protein
MLKIINEGKLIFQLNYNLKNRVTGQESRENKMGYQPDYYLNGNVTTDSKRNSEAPSEIYETKSHI